MGNIEGRVAAEGTLDERLATCEKMQCLWRGHLGSDAAEPTDHDVRP